MQKVEKGWTFNGEKINGVFMKHGKAFHNSKNLMALWAHGIQLFLMAKYESGHLYLIHVRMGDRIYQATTFDESGRITETAQAFMVTDRLFYDGLRKRWRKDGSLQSETLYDKGHFQRRIGYRKNGQETGVYCKGSSGRMMRVAKDSEEFRIERRSW